ncbi:uncharacterized protein ACHE_60659S [Aspergillus chevalieri]|uniref:Uncharacterized protein n=1 Tax=Aspergillus chevalieri TaxID=182096 RepID=A0A7R7VV51_ASPCH|nr:uncharacterized protein ACHE_60659S [Aspergillus chevalieri]BCR90773.1 hypothetical protein ACHE_60659S [Aspergillus chevalieri]
MLFFLQSFSEKRSTSHLIMNLSLALLLQILSASKTSSAGTSTRLRAVGGSFENATTSKIVQEDRSEIYSWIKKALTVNKVIEDVKKQKFNFTRDDFQNTTSSLWTRDSPIFIHGLLKIFILFALQVYLFTGARIGAFVPEHKYRNQRGLRYRVPQ